MRHFRYTMLALLLVMAAGCTSQKTRELETKVSDMQQEIALRDLYIKRYTETIAEINASLAQIAPQEKNAIKQSAVLEQPSGSRNFALRKTIFQNITGIKTELQNNKIKLGKLNSEVKAYKFKYDQLQKSVQILTEAIEEREKTIVELQLKVSGLSDTLAMQKMLINAQEEKINEAFYAAGTEKDLIKKGVLKKLGGNILGGKTLGINDSSDPSLFAKISMNDKSIELEKEIIKIAPDRAIDTYKINGKTLEILNNEKFWKNKYLAIITK